MDKTPEKVTKDPKRQKRGKKSHKTYMKTLKEKILEHNQLPTLSPMDRSTPSTPSSTPPTSSSTGDPMPSTLSHARKLNDTYVYGVVILAVLAIGVCVFFVYNTFQLNNKKQAIEKKYISHQNNFICFKNIYNK